MLQLTDIDGTPAGFTFEELDMSSIKLHLVSIAALFLEHRMQEDWAIGYLHYEFKIDPSLVMVHKSIASTTYCIPIELATLNMSQLKPHTYQLDNGVLHPLEFELYPTLQRPRHNPPPEFLARLADILQAIPGGYTLCLCPRESQIMSRSFMRPEDCGGAGGFIVRPLESATAPAVVGTAWVETQWNFDYTADVHMPDLATVISEQQPLLEGVVDERLLGEYWPLKIHVQQKCLVKV